MRRSKKKHYIIKPSGFSKFSYVFLGIMSVVFLYPMFLAVMVSLTSQDSIRQNGFQVIPSEFSVEAYRLLFKEYGKSLFRSMFLTIGTGIIQPVLSIILTVCMAYPLSQPDFAGKNIWRKYLIITMIFSGGLIPTYILYTKYLHLKNSVMVYLLPGLAAWNVFLFRTFFVSIDSAMIESAKIDGASNFSILFRIMLPLTKPLVAMNFFQGFLDRWNDIQTPLYYITDPKLYTVQYLLQQMLISAEQAKKLISIGMVTNVGQSLNIPVEAIRYALAVIGALPVLIIFPYIQKYYSKGIMLGSTKG